jgi:single-stranded-DNA-specific exonuclease
VIVSDGDGNSYPLVWWQGAGLPRSPDRFDLAYRVRASTFRGEGLSIEWVDARWEEESESTPFELYGEKRLPFDLVDLRNDPDATAQLDRMCGLEEVEIWAEGLSRPKGTYLRSELTQAAVLVVWTIPPSPAVLAEALNRVKPKKIILLAYSPGPDSAQPFLQTLGGMVKNVLSRYGGLITLKKLAGVSGQTENAVSAGLLWLEAKGMIAIDRLAGGDCALAAGTGKADRSAAESAETRLRLELEESTAYREYYRNAPAEILFTADLQK